jgi:hypothetical protein
MKTIPWLFGNALAGYLDLCVGAMIAALTAHFFGAEALWWRLGIGSILAVLPDFDIMFSILAAQKVDSAHHRSPLHRPLLVLPLVGLAAYALGGDYWEATALLCVCWHYIHDTRGFGGGGIMWAWPVSKKYWSLSGAHALIHGDHEKWIEEKWMRPSTLSIGEVLLGTLALAVALIASQAL